MAAKARWQARAGSIAAEFVPLASARHRPDYLLIDASGAWIVAPAGRSPRDFDACRAQGYGTEASGFGSERRALPCRVEGTVLRGRWHRIVWFNSAGLPGSTFTSEEAPAEL